MIELKQTVTYEKWEVRPRDKRARILIGARLMHLAAGLPGDIESVGEEVNELRLHYC